MAYPNGQASAYSYLSTTQDLRLQTIHHQRGGGTTLSRFDYTYDTVGNLLTWQQQADSAAATVWRYGYDAVDQLTSAVHQTTDATPTLLARYGYAYDLAGNRTVEQMDDAATLTSHDRLNRLTTQVPGGTVTFTGTVNEPATVTVQRQPATVTSGGVFTVGVPAASGTNTVSVVATDASGNVATAVFEQDQVGTTKTFTSDANGNLTTDGTRGFEWDARNQLVAVTVGTHRSEFAYDGLQRRVRMVEKESGVVVSDQRFVWDAKDPVERRDGTGTVVTARRFRHGDQDNGVSQIVTRDHLLSAREVTDVVGTLQSRYAYGPFGTLTTVTGGYPELGAFTSVMAHEASGLYLMQRRAYDARLGRWLSEDPLGMVEGPNLYGYIVNHPLRWIDPEGTLPIIPDPYRPGPRWNGSITTTTSKQDDKCSVWDWVHALIGRGSCTTACCRIHDDCYAAGKCNATSWLTLPIDTTCGRCNQFVVACIETVRFLPDDACLPCGHK